MPVDFKEISKRWQKKWSDSKAFEADASDRPKFFITTPYPYVNGLLHMGHTYTYVRVDALARFKRMCGFNVLFPFAFHATGSPIDTAARKVAEGEPGQINALKLMGFKDSEIEKFKDPLHWVKTFSQEAKKDLSAYGMSIDWRRSFLTTDLNPFYDKFIRWQFNTLRAEGRIGQGEHPVVWCPKEDGPVGDHARSEGEGEVPEEWVIVKFKAGDLILPCATKRPETLFGVTNIWINPDLEYVRVRVDGEVWVLAKQAVSKLGNQKHAVDVLGSIGPDELLSLEAENPLTGSKVPVLSAGFVNAEKGTGVVMSVPAHAPFDFAALLRSKAGISPIQVIDVPGRSKPLTLELVKESSGDADLEKLTRKVYLEEEKSGVMSKIAGKYSELPVSKARDEIVADLDCAIPFYELSGPVVCRCLTPCVVRVVDDQWFLKYSDFEWKQEAAKALESCKLYPEKLRDQFLHVIDWLKDWACTREFGLGTDLPWDEKWKIESLSDSTIYPAFYTIAHLIEGLPEDKVTDKLFDFIFKDGSLPEGVDRSIAEDMRTEFSYWYPVDVRNSGKDLVQNHLTFYLFNHTAIFDEKYWPRGISVNGHVLINGEKMSKSKGNFKTLRDVVGEFSADVVRLSVLSLGEDANDVDWHDEVASSMHSKLNAWYDFAVENYASEHIQSEALRTVDRWMEHKLHECIRDSRTAMDEMLFRTAIQRGFFDLQRHLKWYLKRSSGKPSRSVLNKVIEAQTLILAPFAPHLCEEIWFKLEREGFISAALYPVHDESKINPALESSERLISQVIDDVHQVMRLAKVEKPNRIQLLVAPDWKGELCRRAEKLIRQTRNAGEIIKALIPDFKEHSKEVSALISKWVKDPSKLPENAAHEEAELKDLNDAREFFKGVFGCIVEVIPARESEHPKARNAMPSKPAIVVE